MERCIVLLKVTISLRERCSRKRVYVISNDVEVSCSAQSCVHGYEGTRCTQGKHSSHHNPSATSLKNCHLAVGVCEFVLFASYSDYDICMMEQETRFITRLLFSCPQVTNFVVLLSTTCAFSYFSMIPKALLVVSCCWRPSFVKSVLLIQRTIRRQYALWCTYIDFRCNFSCCCPSVASDYSWDSHFTYLVHQPFLTRMVLVAWGIFFSTAIL